MAPRRCDEALQRHGLSLQSSDIFKHDMTKQKTSFGQSDVVRLSDEDAAVELLERAVTGL